MANKSGSEAEQPFVVVTRPSQGVALVTMNRPKTLNAMTAMDALEMHDKVVELNKDETVRCVVLTGSGRGFCAGADVSPLGKSLVTACTNVAMI